MLIFTLLFGYFQQYKWLVIFFMLFICGGGFLNGSLANLRGAAAAKFTPFQGGESYVAVFALISFLSSFIGSLLSGWIFVLCRDLAGGDAENHFGLYFKVICIPEIILLLPLYNRGCLLLDKKSN